jgi:hypothetical protein
MNIPRPISSSEIPRNIQAFSVPKKGVVVSIDTSSKKLINRVLMDPKGHRMMTECRDVIPGMGLMSVDPLLLKYLDDNFNPYRAQ